MRSGELAAGTPALLARVGIGVAVRQGAPLPDVSTTEGFKQALLSARAVACIDSNAGGTSGIYLAQLLKKMAVQQKSDLVAVHGAKVVGPFPAEAQNYPVYSGAISSKTTERAAAIHLLSALQQPAARATLPARGLMAP